MLQRARRRQVAALLPLLIVLWAACASEPEKKHAAGPVTRMSDRAFVQESHLEYERADVEGYVTGIPQPANRFFAVFADGSVIYAGGASGLYRSTGGMFEQLLADTPIYSLLVVGDDLYAGTDDAVLIGQSNAFTPLAAALAGRVRALAQVGDNIFAGTDGGLYVRDGGAFVPWGEPLDHQVNDLAVAPDGALWAATNNGLYRLTGAGVQRWSTDDYLLRMQVTGLAFDDAGDLWIGTGSGLNRLDNDGLVVSFTGAQGLPMTDVTSVAFAAAEEAGGVWIGSSKGAIRYADPDWNFYRGRRWLPDDRVNDIAADEAGNVWLATGNGVSRLSFDAWTLAKKAERYLALNEERHNRYGLASACALDLPGDLETFRGQDDDNDGLWTGMYLAALSFAYAVSGDPDIKALADERFAAMAFLEEVTGISGLPARSVAPLHTYSLDPSCYPNCQWRANEELGWDWKSDTSSDEITGHFYAYAIYYDLVAEGEQREQVIELVWRMAAAIVDHDYFLIDWDGEPTTWGVWNPTYLWEWYKQPLDEGSRYLGLVYPNSLEILSFMRTAYHITGDDRFAEAYHELAVDYALADLALSAALYLPMVTNHSTNELLYLAYYPLLRYETDEVLRAKYLDSLRRTFSFTRVEQASLFDITFGALTEGGEDFDLPVAVNNLQQIPLDLVEWTMTNSDRADVVFDPLPNRFGELISATDQPPLPPDERPLMIWNGDPFVLDGGAAGFREQAGTFWLLPYWMARYHEFIVD